MNTDIFYTLPQLSTGKHTDLKYRMVKYRFNKLLLEDEIEIGQYVKKESNKWYIHYSLIDKFQPVRKRTTHTKIRHKYEITINLKIDYDLEFYKLLGHSLLKELHPANTVYHVEKSKYFHIHLATDADYLAICSSLTKVGNTMDINIINEKYTHISEIGNNGSYANYIAKASLDHGFSGMDSYADFDLSVDEKWNINIHHD